MTSECTHLRDNELGNAVREAYDLYLHHRQGVNGKGIQIGHWLVDRTSHFSYHIYYNNALAGILELGQRDKLWSFDDDPRNPVVADRFNNRFGKIASIMYQWVWEGRKHPYDILLWGLDSQHALIVKHLEAHPTSLKDIPANTMSSYVNLQHRVKSFDVTLRNSGRAVSFTANYHSGDCADVWYCNGNHMMHQPEDNNLGGALNGWRLLAWAASHVMKTQVSGGE